MPLLLVLGDKTKMRLRVQSPQDTVQQRIATERQKAVAVIMKALISVLPMRL